MHRFRSRRTKTSPARTRHMRDTGQQLLRATRQRRKPSSGHREQSVTHPAMHTDHSTELRPSEQATAVLTSDSISLSHDQSNPAAAADDPNPGAANGQAASVNEGMAIDETNVQSNPVEAADGPAPEEAAVPVEGPTASANENMAMESKEKMVLFLRHKLQKCLLARNQDPKEVDMAQASNFLTILEGYTDLEVSILRKTKVRKVLKAILKLNNIPKEKDFDFKHRSQTLLEKWNQLLAAEQSTPATVPAAGVCEDTIMAGAPADPTTNAADSPADPVEAANELAMAATASEHISVDARSDEAAANDSAPNEIEDDHNDEEIPDYIRSYFQRLEDEDDSNCARDDDLTSDNVSLRTFRPRKPWSRHYQQRNFHVEHVTMVLDRVLVQVQERIGEANIPRDSLEDFLSSELDATSVTIGVLNWLITKDIPKYRMELSRSLRQVREGRV